MSLIKDIKTILTDAGVQTPLFLAFMPDTNANAKVSIHATGGYAPNIAARIDEPTIQIFAKAKDYEDGYTILEQIRDVLINTQDVIVGDTRYMAVHQQGDIADMGFSDNYFSFSLNFRLYKTKN